MMMKKVVFFDPVSVLLALSIFFPSETSVRAKRLVHEQPVDLWPQRVGFMRTTWRLKSNMADRRSLFVAAASPLHGGRTLRTVPLPLGSLSQAHTAVVEPLDGTLEGTDTHQ